MEQADCAVSHNIACLRQCSALIRFTPALWPLWWPLLRACDAAAARFERTLARQRHSPTDALRREVIDLGEWRRRSAEARVGRREPAGGAA